MKYFLINVKKIYKNKLNSIPVFIIILFLVFLYVGMVLRQEKGLIK